MQRAAFIAVLSFAFFLAMMFAYYIRESMGYFLLATAFLLLYLLTIFSWFMQRKNMVTIFEEGVRYKELEARWEEITTVSDAGRIERVDGAPIEIPNTIHDFDRVLQLVRFRSGAARQGITDV